MPTTRDLLLFNPNNGTILYESIITTISAVHNVFIFTHILRINCSSPKELCNQTKLNKLVFVSTTTAIFSWVLFQLFMTFIGNYYWINSLSCNILWTITVIGYCTSKYCIWLCAVVRFTVISYGSTFNICCHKQLITIHFIYFIICVCINTLVVYYPFTEIITAENVPHFPSCQIFFPFWFGFISGGLAACASVSLLVLFYLKLRAFIRLNDDCTDTKVIYITKKHLVLLLIEVSSTSVLIAGVLTPMLTSLLSIDGMVNIWCLLLFDSKNDWMYSKCCGKCVGKRHSYNNNNKNETDTQRETECVTTYSVVNTTTIEGITNLQDHTATVEDVDVYCVE